MAQMSAAEEYRKIVDPFLNIYNISLDGGSFPLADQTSAVLPQLFKNILISMGKRVVLPQDAKGLRPGRLELTTFRL